METNLSAQEAQFNELLKTGQNQAAVELLSQMAIACAREGDFVRAESFRDQLYEVDSMALSAIVKVNEVIEAEKTKALTPDRRRLWARFFEALSTEESNAFFFALNDVVLEEERVVLKQGGSNDRLYLVNQGQLKVVHEGADKQLLIRTLSTGDIFGEDTFFSINVCTASVVTLLKTKVSYLERDKLDGLSIQYPVLEKHLQELCGSGKRMYDWLRQKGIDRRAYKRVNLSTKIAFQILTPEEGTAMQRPVVAELWDISKCGLSFYFQSKNREAVRRMVGRTLGVSIKLSANGREKEIALTGIVHGVQDHPLDEYSVHLQLRRNFSDEAIRTIHRIAEQQEGL
ncbi:MAG: cyclic nucleotide-binding domain-containing protein [Desulfobacteraceae bacterium]|nr:MAG: cyclic nucleotide-binding domain-containing protein [Desulfobacteraceae bacterium]